NKVFFAGGMDANLATMYDVVDIYDTTTQTWMLSHLTTARAWAAATSIDDLFMIGGGINETFFPLGSVEIYSLLTGVKDAVTESGPEVFPNPVADQLNFFNTIQHGSMQITNALGEIVYQKNLDSQSDLISITTNQFSKGVYILKITEEGKSLFRKFIKN
ncbi:MAG TPA: T9SS type A sorting domain-containing protein, partial [Bacteroidia bacterium]|nr:T9SS type A sorting domain-containing protein [Bacteroidia bacterium]